MYNFVQDNRTIGGCQVFVCNCAHGNRLTTFQKKCPLLRFEGYIINGSNNNGFTVINNQRSNQGAKNDLRNVCGKCSCHTEGNCRPEVETGTPTAEIYAAIE